MKKTDSNILLPNPANTALRPSSVSTAPPPSSPTGGALAAIVPVVTYNILTPPYAMSHDSNPVDLDPKTRLNKVLGKLAPLVAEHMEQKESDLWVQNLDSDLTAASARSIICLQEVGESWVGPLHAFFQKNNYHFVTSLYGRKDSDYFGVAIAFPNEKYELVEAKVVKPADWKKWPAELMKKQFRPQALLTLTGWKRLFTEHFDLVLWALKWFFICLFFFWCIWIYFVYLAVRYWKMDSVIVPWKYARDRQNAQILLRLKARDTASVEFAVSNYHMPCTFWSPVSLSCVSTIFDDNAAGYGYPLCFGNAMLARFCRRVNSLYSLWRFQLYS
jgi:hypothetical protein